MFNYDAEVFVIIYPFAGGGKFLQMAMHLDPGMPVLIPGKPKPTHEQIIDYLQTHQNAHVVENEQTPKYIESLPPSSKYVFQFHQEILEWEAINSIMRKCARLRPVFITCGREASRRLVNRRRLDKNDLQFITPTERAFNNFLPRMSGLWWGAEPALVIEVEDYWNPANAKSILNDFFARYNIVTPGWEQLYDVWHANSVAPSL